jgi:hypothetical protein
LILGYRIASPSSADYPIHKTIREGTFHNLVSLEDESTRTSIRTFVEDCDANGETPLLLATRKGLTQCVEVLLSRFECDQDYRHSHSDGCMSFRELV